MTTDRAKPDRRKWQLWSQSPDGANNWLVVDSGSKTEMQQGRDRRNKALEQRGLEGRFVALPRGEAPSRDGVHGPAKVGIRGGTLQGGPPMADQMTRLRAAWNNYAFARAGIAPGAGMAVLPEPKAWEVLSATFQAFTASWDMGPTAAEIIDMVRQARADADAMAEQLANDIDIARPYARRSIAIAMRELLEAIPGTPEADAVAAAELRWQQELDERERQLHAADDS
jgi:hypothetical protein